MAPFLFEAAAVLIVAAIVATFGYSSGKRALQKKIDEAATGYVMRLDDLLHRSVEQGEAQALVNGREIADKIEAFREPLDNMRQHLNSEIDVFVGLVREGARTNNRKELFAAIASLRSAWPGRRRSIESETRRLLALLGVE